MPGAWSSTSSKVARVLHVGRALHRVPTDVVKKRLRADVVLACDESDDWLAAVALDDGTVLLVPSDALMARVTPLDVQDRLVELAGCANAELHFGGHWVFAWDGSEVHALWRDQDGDMQLTNSFNEPWSRLRSKTWVEFANVLAACWTEAMARLEMLDLKDHHKYRAALGERRPERSRH